MMTEEWNMGWPEHPTCCAECMFGENYDAHGEPRYCALKKVGMEPVHYPKNQNCISVIRAQCADRMIAGLNSKTRAAVAFEIETSKETCQFPAAGKKNQAKKQTRLL
jgi:hypothetical protein